MIGSHLQFFLHTATKMPSSPQRLRSSNHIEHAIRPRPVRHGDNEVSFVTSLVIRLQPLQVSLNAFKDTTEHHSGAFLSLRVQNQS